MKVVTLPHPIPHPMNASLNLNPSNNSTDPSDLPSDFSNLSPNQKAVSIQTSLRELLLSISQVLKTKAQANQILQNSSRASNGQTSVLNDNLKAAQHSNLLDLVGKTDVYLARLLGFRDWLVSTVHTGIFP